MYTMLQILLPSDYAHPQIPLSPSCNLGLYSTTVISTCAVGRANKQNKDNVVFHQVPKMCRKQAAVDQSHQSEILASNSTHRAVCVQGDGLSLKPVEAYGFPARSAASSQLTQLMLTQVTQLCTKSQVFTPYFTFITSTVSLF